MTQSRGRPRQFNREEAIEQALHIFWQYGYESTSLSQLKQGLGGGITAPSFYSAFGSKEALFKECAQLYIKNYAQVTEPLWDESLSPREAIEIALTRSIKMQCDTSHPLGCMVSLGVMSAPSKENSKVTELLTHSREKTRKGFEHCLKRAIEAGELSPKTNVKAFKTVLDSFLNGVSILVRDGASEDDILSAVDQIMQMWDHSKLT